MAPLGNMNPRVLLWLGFVVGSFTIMASSSVATFTAYAEDIKIIFNFTQLEVQIVAAAGNLGQCAALPAGIFLEKFGSRPAFFLAIIFVVPPYLLLWQFGTYSNYFQENYGIIAVYMFLIGVGSTIMYLSVITVNLNNFPRRHRGKVVGFLGALFWVGPLLFAALYGTQYADSDMILQYFFILGIMCLIANLLAMVFTRRVERQEDPEEQEYNEDGCEIRDSREHIYVEAVSLTEKSEANLTGVKLLSSTTFQLLAWTFILTTSVDLAFLNNQSIVLAACDNIGLTFTSNLLEPIVGGFGNILSGVLSDRLAKRIPRETLVVVGVFMQPVLMSLFIYYPCQQEVFVAGLLVGYYSFATNFTIFPTLICMYFGLTHFSRNWGAVMLVYGIMSGALLLIFGLSYDTETVIPATVSCHGPNCFMVFFIVTSVVSIVGVIVSALMLAYVCVSRKPLPEVAPVVSEERAISYESIISEPTAGARPRRFSEVYETQLIQRSFTSDKASNTESASVMDWLHTS